MKNAKLLFCMLVGLLVLSPVCVNALTEEEAIANQEAIFDKVSTSNEDGTCTWNFKVIEKDTLFANSCNISKEKFLEGHEWCDGVKCSELNDTDLAEAMQQEVNTCKTNIFSAILSQQAKKVGLDAWIFSYDYENFDNVFKDGKFIVKTFYEYDQNDGNPGFGEYTKSCHVNFVNSDNKANKQMEKVAEDMKASYELYSLSTFNSVFHYGSLNNDLFDSSLVTFRFPMFKKIQVENPEFKFDVEWNGAGGTDDITGCDGNVIVSQNDSVYAVRHVNFALNHVLYVDKDAEGTVFEKAENRLNDYFKDKAEVEVKVIEIDQDMLDDMGGVYTDVKINGHGNSILIKEVSRDELDKYEVEASHKSTGVKVNSNSYEVPTDATLDVEDVTDEISKKFDKEMYKVHSAYDIEVVKMADGGFVKTIENGIDVYLPISGRTVGEEMTVYHITDNEKGDGYKGVVVEVEGKQYVKFTTTHFSTYAVVEELGSTGDVGTGEIELEENPNTFDGVGYSIITLLVSIITLGGCIIYKRKFN